MKVYGDLEKAILEQIANAAPTAWGRGAIYSDITNPTASVPRYWNGTSWKEFQFVTVDPGMVSQNSGTAITVDWSTSLLQRVVLTDNCLISFSNPQENKTHTLIVTQAPQSERAFQNIKYAFKLNMPDQDCGTFSYQPQVAPAYGANVTYTWIYKTNFVPATQTAVPPNILSSIPAPVAGVAGVGLGLSPDGTALGMGAVASPFVSFYNIYPHTRRNSYFFGVRNGDFTPGAASGAIKDVCYHPDGSAIFVASAITPFIQVFGKNKTGSANTSAWGNPATLPAGAAQCVDVNIHGTHVAVGHATTPFMTVYEYVAFSSTPSIVKIANPVSLPAAQVNAVKFSPFGDYIAVASQTTPFLEVYAFSYYLNTIGSKSANPGTLPAGGPAADLGGDGVAWHPSGNWIALSMSVTPYIYIVPFNRLTGTFGTPLTFTDAAIAQNAGARGVAWTPCGNYLVTFGGGSLTASAAVYDFSAQTIGSAAYFVDGALGSPNAGLEISRDGKSAFLAKADTSGVSVFDLPSKQKNYERIA